jgi:hypothetical protein
MLANQNALLALTAMLNFQSALCTQTLYNLKKKPCLSSAIQFSCEPQVLAFHDFSGKLSEILKIYVSSLN